MTERRTVADAHARIDVLEADQNSHERLCAERYGNIDKKMDSYGRRTTRIEVAAWGILASLVLALLKAAGFIG